MGALADSRLHQRHDFIDKQAETTHRQKQQSEKKQKEKNKKPRESGAGDVKRGTDSRRTFP
jgi:hypothetical protein